MTDAGWLPGELEDLDWTADTLSGTIAATSAQIRPVWALGDRHLLSDQVLYPKERHDTDFRDPRVGWGLILPDAPGLVDGQPDDAAEAPEPIRQLLAARGGKVLRYRAGTPIGEAFLHDYPAGLSLSYAAGSAVGAGPGCIPRYLLIYASPTDIPWRVQSQLNSSFFVGRLDLEDEGLRNYVACALTDWAGSTVRYGEPVVWCADLGGGEITTVMRRAIGDDLAARFRDDPDTPGLSYLGEGGATVTGSDLMAALAGHRPAVVVTTSHGVSEPGSPGALAQQLGLPVDADLKALDPAALLAQWQPDGAVWFAQACCSAGADRPSSYQGLFPAASTIAGSLAAASGAGPLIAPLPRVLLGARRPLRAFIGRVEPTFRWTLQSPWTNIPLAQQLVEAIYLGVCGFQPVGHALRDWFSPIGGLLAQADRLAVDYDTTEDPALAAKVRSLSVYDRVLAYDRANLVILGDPAVALPRPATSG